MHMSLTLYLLAVVLPPGATMSGKLSLTQSAQSVQLVLTGDRFGNTGGSFSQD